MENSSWSWDSTKGLDDRLTSWSLFIRDKGRARILYIPHSGYAWHIWLLAGPEVYRRPMMENITEGLEETLAEAKERVEEFFELLDF